MNCFGNASAPGIHPHDAANWDAAAEENVRRLARHPKCVGDPAILCNICICHICCMLHLFSSRFDLGFVLTSKICLEFIRQLEVFLNISPRATFDVRSCWPGIGECGLDFFKHDPSEADLSHHGPRNSKEVLVKQTLN